MAGHSYPLAVVISAFDKFSAPLGHMGGQLAKFGKSAKHLGHELTIGLTLPIAAFATASVHAALDVEENFHRIEARTNATAAEMERLTKAADQLGDAPFTIEKSAEAMRLLAEEGENADTVIARAPAALELANAAHQDLAESVKTTVTIFDAYNVQGEEVERTTDQIIAAAQHANLTNLTEGLALVGARSHSLNQSLPDTLGILEGLRKVGVPASASAKTIARGLEALRAPSKDAQHVLAQLKVRRDEVFEPGKGPRALIDVLDTLEKHGATALQVYRIFGKQAGPGMAQLLGQGTEAARKFREEVLNSTGAAAREHAIELSGASGALKKFEAGWQKLEIAVARSGLLEIFAKTVTILGSLVRWLANAHPWILKVGVVVGLLAAVAGPALVVIGSLAQIFSALSIAAAALGVGMGAILAPIAAVALGIAAGIAVGYLLVHNWDAIKAAAKSALEYIEDKVGSVVAWVGRQWAKLEAVTPSWISDFFTGGDTATHFTAEGPGNGAPPPGSGLAARARAVGNAQTTSARADVSGRVQVAFANLPRGARVSSTSTGDVPVDVELGANMAGGL